jgi:mono/diheme cytochrome c family protein
MFSPLAGAAAGGSTPRWYTPAQVERGRVLYAGHCATCHGARGEGQPNWQERDAMGFYPPPPLNADGHAWQHPLGQMLRQLETGGGPRGGTMPSFIDVLDGAGRRAVLAYMQSLWPADMYERWLAIDSGRAAPPDDAGHALH